MKFKPGVVPQCPNRRGLMCFRSSGCFEQRIVEQVDLSDRQIIGRAPVAVHGVQQVGREGPVGRLRLALRGGAAGGSGFDAGHRWTPYVDELWPSCNSDMGMPGDHLVFVGRDHAHRRPNCSATEITGRWAALRSLVEPQAQEFQVLADFLANLGGMLADAAGEDDGVESAQRAGIGGQKFLGLIAKQFDRERARVVGSAAGNQIAHVGRRAGNAEQARLFADQPADVGRRKLAVFQQIDQRAGIEIAASAFPSRVRRSA